MLKTLAEKRRDDLGTVKRWWLLLIGVGVTWTAAMVGGASAFSQPDAFPLQRATPTPALTLSLPTPLRILPLPTIELTPARTVTATPALTPTRPLAVTPVRTPTPTRTVPPATPTPTLVPLTVDEDDEEDGEALNIVDFMAAPLRLRGQIQLSWRYEGEPFEGSFWVERSVNGGVWRAVSACALPYEPETDEPEAERHRCLDTGLVSGSTYVYRICVVENETSCVDQAVVESAAVKAP